MANDILIIIGAIIPIFWGIGHIFPTKNVVRDFGEITEDNKKILQMEWLNEALTLNFIGILNLVVTIIGGSSNNVSLIVYIISAIMLFGMAILSLMTGAKIDFLPYKLCPVLFSSSAVLILLGAFF